MFVGKRNIGRNVRRNVKRLQALILQAVPKVQECLYHL